MGLIDKAAVVAILEEWRSKIQMGVISIPLHGRQKADAAYEYELLGRVKDVIGILEVKEKEVDLEKHLKEDIEDVYFDLNGVAVKGATYYLTVEDIKEIAKHFFELGLKAQKGE